MHVKNGAGSVRPTSQYAPRLGTPLDSVRPVSVRPTTRYAPSLGTPQVLFLKGEQLPPGGLPRLNRGTLSRVFERVVVGRAVAAAGRRRPLRATLEGILGRVCVPFYTEELPLGFLRGCGSASSGRRREAAATARYPQRNSGAGGLSFLHRGIPSRIFEGVW